MFAQKVLLATLGLSFLFGCALSYGSSGGDMPMASYEAIPNVDGPSANPDSDIAAAKASASRISSANLPALHQYGYEIGKPLLIKDFGALTNLYSALAPKRSFVGTIDAGVFNFYSLSSHV